MSELCFIMSELCPELCPNYVPAFGRILNQKTGSNNYVRIMSRIMSELCFIMSELCFIMSELCFIMFYYVSWTREAVT